VALLAFASGLALESLPAFHDHVHEDAHETEHHCVVTILQQGQVEIPCCVVAVVPAVAALVALIVVESGFVPSVDYSLPPSCGPPALLA
jgi:hypothetical protein